ncbi:TlpA family protein disulfide reductase [Rhizosphaericola mali]|uniref:TlpA family protein disulfide reductase n=1 Tax=Rhizosphaericola mali TaxID=2545455 RepID=A0A5P2G9U5_9BACT|nr:TlpA disulfide reductase family protein [Rhizosphaericola mali]QES89973.1 TlpA family protein disulfide reductase [Rhizosphaericola mali]
MNFNKLIICFLLCFYYQNLNAQISILQKVITKVERYENFSYKEHVLIKSSFNPKPIENDEKYVFLKMPNVKYNYFFKQDVNGSVSTYNEAGLVELDYKDSSYSFIDTNRYSFDNTLLGYLNQLKEIVNNPKCFEQKKDTLINGFFCYHFIEKDVDSTSNERGDYLFKHWFINKSSNNVTSIIYMWRMRDAGKNLITNCMQSIYTDLKFDQLGINKSIFNIPSNFKLKNIEKRSLLPTGVIAPDFVMHSTEGDSLTLAQLKGKVVIIDFSFIGCLPCLQAIKPMNNILKKYKNSPVEIISVYPQRDLSSIKNYIKEHDIQYSIYFDKYNGSKLYDIPGYPSFYIINKDGVIAYSLEGFVDDFEEKISKIIDKQLL